MPLSAVF